MSSTLQSISSFSRSPHELLGESAAVVAARSAVAKASGSGEPVLIVAERGFDTERVGRAIHGGATAPFLGVDCAANPPDVILRELFGRTGGRRTSLEAVDPASAASKARGGTLMLIGLAQLPAAAQLRLWRLLRDGEMRIGSSAVPFDVRILGAAQPGLEQDVLEERFQRDLYERLRRHRIEIPPLRERREDLPAIIRAVLQDVCAARGISRSLAPAAITALSALPWTGNLDELRFVLDRLAGVVPSGVIRQEDVLADLRPAPPPRKFPSLVSLREARTRFEREYIAAVLQEHGWSMSAAARTLGIERANLYRKTRQLGIRRLKPSRAS